MIDIIRENKILYPFLNFIVEFETVTGEEFDAIVLEGIMRGRYDYTRICSHATGNKGDTWRW